MQTSSPDMLKLERMSLQSLLKSLDADQPNFSRSRTFVPGLLLAISLGAAISWLDLPLLDHPVVVAIEPLFALALGATTMYLIFRSLAKAHYFFARPYIDRAAIEARLRELGP